MGRMNNTQVSSYIRGTESTPLTRLAVKSLFKAKETEYLRTQAPETWYQWEEDLIQVACASAYDVDSFCDYLCKRIVRWATMDERKAGFAIQRAGGVATETNVEAYLSKRREQAQLLDEWLESEPLTLERIEHAVKMNEERTATKGEGLAVATMYGYVRADMGRYINKVMGRSYQTSEGVQTERGTITYEPGSLFDMVAEGATLLSVGGSVDMDALFDSVIVALRESAARNSDIEDCVDLVYGKLELRKMNSTKRNRLVGAIRLAVAMACERGALC